MCIWISPYHTTTALIVKTIGIQNSGFLLRSKLQPEVQHGAVFEDIDPFKTTLTSMSSTYKGNFYLYMLWMCIWMITYHATFTLVSLQAFGS